jgi:class 3 adenylate cyclase
MTFLFTDVEGSTPLWEQHEVTMRAVTARHDALLDAVITAHGGHRVKERGEGDSIFAVFPQPTLAVTAALGMARAVLDEPWPPETPIRVRMALHCGAAQFRAGDYYGPVINRCARIRGLGHGGQVLLSAATAVLVRDALPAGASLRSLGEHRLKGLSAPEEVFQLCHAALPSDFPPLLSPQAPRHNLPEILTSLVGREAEQGEVLALMRASEDRAGITAVLDNLGSLTCRMAEYERAEALHRESLGLSRDLGDQRMVAIALNSLTLVLHCRGDQAQAAALVGEALQTAHAIGAPDVEASALELAAQVATARRNPSLAARLGGAAEARRETLGMALDPGHRPGHEQAMQAMHAALDDQTFATAWAEGRALPLDHVIALTRSATAPSNQAP